MGVHYPHYTDPKNKPGIVRTWKEVRSTKCPIKNSQVKEKLYEGTFVEYYFTNKKGKRVYVPELIILVKWLEE